MIAMKKIVLLGASGSIGSSTLEVIANNPNKFELVGISIYNNLEVLKKILAKFPTIKLVGVKELKKAQEIIKNYPHIKFVEKQEGLIKLVKSDYDLLVNAIVGFAGLEPTYYAILNKKDVALANKETLVAGGSIIMKIARENQVKIYPIDSEHSAIFQCLEKENPIKKVIITASGGPFFKLNKEELKHVSLEQALNHPNWKMGKKITIDSATMFNKAFEVIEAYYLFNLKPSQIEVLIHPQSIIHSMVEFADGSIKAQLAMPDMKIPIAYALNYPYRLKNITPSLDFKNVPQLNFYPADFDRFISLKLAFKVLENPGTSGAVLNAANEMAVKLFLENKIKFYQIENLVLKTFNAHQNKIDKIQLSDIIQADLWAREYTRRLVDDLI